jgi:hypothetical protein
MTATALAAVVLLVGAASAWAAFVVEGSPYTVGNEPYSLAAGDFNSDGRADVAIMNGSSPSDNVSVFLRQPAGGFAEEAGSPISVDPGSGPSGVAVGDYNADGRPDIAVSRFVHGGVSVLLRRAAGGFAVEGVTASGTAYTSITAGHFGGDARLDLAVTQPGGGVALLLRNGTNSGFTVQAAGGTGANPSGIATGDFDGNGLADLATANRNDDNVSILLQGPAGQFTAQPVVAVGDQPIGIVAANFNGSGGSDIAVGNYGGSTVSTLLRRASNDGFDVEPPVSVALPGGVDAADFDRDGRVDLAVASNSGTVEILLRNAGGGFTRDQSIALAGAVNDVVAANFDGDSRPDLAASSLTNALADTFTAMLNPGPPAPPPTGPTPLPPPVAGTSVNVEPVSGTVRIKRPGSGRFVTLTAEAQIPVGSTIDTRRGRITITAAQGGGSTAVADFFDGLFKLTQTKGARPLTTLALTERLACPRKASASTAARKKKKRRLWGDGRGRFRTKGKHSAATVVGTRWLVQDRCRSTLTRVVRGRVKVRDFAKRKTVTVRAGKRYTARAKRR